MEGRIVLLIDMDYFFAQIEERRNPSLKTKPVVVGALPKEGKGRGVVATCNYLAREYGIRSGMPISQAYRLCPQAVFLPVNLSFYQKVSAEIFSIIKKYSKDWEIVSLDEAYLSLPFSFTGKEEAYCQEIESAYQNAEFLASKLKKEIFEKERLKATIGLGPNKMIAKIACHKAKPDGLLAIRPWQVEVFLKDLPVEELPGIGPKTSVLFKKIGVLTVDDLKKVSLEKLVSLFGKNGYLFYQRARGIDNEPVSNQEVVKSIGRQVTFEIDTRKSKIIFEEFEKMFLEISQILKQKHWPCKTLTVICRFKNFETHTKSKTFAPPLEDFNVLEKEAKKILLKFLLEYPKLVRMLGIRVKI